MSEERFVVQEDANTDKIILLIDYKRMKMYSFLAEEREAVNKICNYLNWFDEVTHNYAVMLKEIEESNCEKSKEIAKLKREIGEQQATIRELQIIIKSGKKMNEEKSEEPVYYNSNGLSPNKAFEQGLISNEEFIGFIKGNVIKYVVRCGKKGNPIEDIDKAISYLQLLKKIMRFDDDSKMVIDNE